MQTVPLLIFSVTRFHQLAFSYLQVKSIAIIDGALLQKGGGFLYPKARFTAAPAVNSFGIEESHGLKRA